MPLFLPKLCTLMPDHNTGRLKEVLQNNGLRMKPKVIVFFMATLSVFTAQPEFLSTPGIVKVEPGGTARLVWTVALGQRKEFEIRTKKMNARIPNILLSSTNGVCKIYGNSAIDCINQNSKIGITVNDVSTDDAVRYTCVTRSETFENPLDNSDAVVYMYSTPTVPAIQKNTWIHEGETARMTCQSNSTSFPVEVRHNVSMMEYTWSSSVRIDPGTGSSVTVGPVSREDNGATVTCAASERGSVQNSSITLTIDVMYPPDQSTATMSRSYYTQEVDDLILLCSKPSELGNPPADVFIWQKVGSPEPPVFTTDGILRVPARDVTVTAHNGQWQCWSTNNVTDNPSPRTVITVTVYRYSQERYFPLWVLSVLLTTLVVSGSVYVAHKMRRKQRYNHSSVTVVKRQNLNDMRRHPSDLSPSLATTGKGSMPAGQSVVVYDTCDENPVPYDYINPINVISTDNEKRPKGTGHAQNEGIDETTQEDNTDAEGYLVSIRSNEQATENYLTTSQSTDTEGYLVPKQCSELATGGYLTTYQSRGIDATRQDGESKKYLSLVRD